MGMRKRMLAAAVAVTPLGLIQSEAATVINQDALARRVTIVVADTRDTREIAPGRAIEDICPRGCILRIEGERDADYELDGAEVVSIEGGKLYFDRELQRAGEAARGAAGDPARQPATPAPKSTPR